MKLPLRLAKSSACDIIVIRAPQMKSETQSKLERDAMNKLLQNSTSTIYVLSFSIADGCRYW